MLYLIETMNKETIIHTMGINNCGGRCIIDAHVQNGKITKITTDPSAGSPQHPPLRACVKGFHYHETFLNEEKRLKKPMIRTGKRGSGLFREAEWEEAVDLIAKEWIRIRDTYGPASRYVHYGWGVSGTLRPLDLAKRLLTLDGGFQDYYNSYSTAAIHYTAPYLYGTKFTGSSYEDLLNSKLIILWGHNPAETRFDSLMYYLTLAKNQGISIVCIDPRRNDTARILGAEWIGLRPATDAALADALAYVMITEDLYDHDFTARYCQGFTAETMPKGYEQEMDYFTYCLGDGDGVPKTPEWAAEITGVSPDRIRSLARRMAETKPMALLQGYGAQRNQNGEQSVRGGIMLACLTGNVGISGGSAGGSQLMQNPPVPEIPELKNPVSERIPVYQWTDAVEKGQIRMILNLAGNALINQHGDINRTTEILEDERLCELIVCSDLFMTASAKFADILLPGISFLEMNNSTSPWIQGDFIGFNNKAVEPLGEGRFEYDWLKEIAARLGLYEQFTEGHETGDAWLEDLYEELRSEQPFLPEYNCARQQGIYRYEIPPRIAFREQREHPNRVPFPTPSGRIEIFSPRLFELRDPAVPAIPGYIPAAEGWEDDGFPEYPLQLIGYHTRWRCHSIHGNHEYLNRMESQAVYMNPADAKQRGIHDGDPVHIYNGRGSLRLPCRVTSDIVPGTAAISQGAWYQPDETGTDLGGNINVLTSLNVTPLAKGNAQHTNRVEINKFTAD
ncbi:MAG: molybdopterin-dependent oxidoreductase [Lachnospiraceae bacterium]|nr:molybdopterin-dependent oxidoreductase [Lachnospiraceae bacterium]